MQYAENLGGKSRKNLVEHQIIKNDKEINSTICLFSQPLVKITHSVYYMGPYQLTIPKLGATNSLILEKCQIANFM